MYKILIMGPQGAGKGTQAEILAKELGIPAISMGALLREEIASGSEKGLAAKNFIDSGTLVPDELALEIVQSRLAKPDAAQGWILDGFPRILVQAELFLKFFQPTHVLLLELTEAQSLERLAGRWQCVKCHRGYQEKFVPSKTHPTCEVCGGELAKRSDDVPEVIKQRLKIYHTETEPVAEKFAAMGLLRRVDGSGTVEEVAEAVKRVL